MSENRGFEFFSDYTEKVVKAQPELYAEIARILESAFAAWEQGHGRKPRIIDVGGAGLIPFSHSAVESIAVLDLFDKPRSLALPKNASWIVADITKIETLRDVGKYDFVIMSSLLHHLCDNSNNARRNVTLAFSNTRSLLSQKGQFFIFESTCSEVLAKVQDFLFPATSIFLRKIVGFSNVRMLSVKEIIRSLTESGFKSKEEIFRQPEYVAQLYWRVPTRIYPLKVNCIVAQ